jgi:hypothetical protein
MVRRAWSRPSVSAVEQLHGANLGFGIRGRAATVKRKAATEAVSTPAEAAGPVSVASRNDLIALKQARNSEQDRVDIKGLEDDTDREGSA